MTLARLLLRSLWRFRRTNLGVLLGVAVATTVITGALIVGDSMRHTLSTTAAQRLGSISHTLIGGDRFFTDAIAEQAGPDSEGVVLISGVLSTPDTKSRVNDVAVCGIGDGFIDLLGGPARPGPAEAVLNDVLMQRLGVVIGDTLVLRVPKPSALPVDAALVNASKDALALRVTVTGSVDAEHGGRFSLRAEQRTPLSMFVDRDWLAEQLEQPGRHNAVLMASAPPPINVSLDDLELSLIPSPDDKTELRTERIFLDASIERDLSELAGTRLLTYMVNTIGHGQSESPYAMVCAADGLGDLDLGDDQIAINRLLADDIGANVGDLLTLTYYLPDEGDGLTEGAVQLTVSRIVEIEGPFADRTLTPDFPGLKDAERLSRWDAGPAIDRERIRKEDEAYWDTYKATPKAFISLATGQRLWTNRFGTLTAIRFDEPVESDTLRELIDPVPLGFTPIDVRAQATAAAAGTVDFGQLFLSLSGFIIIAAVVLTATLFVMSAEHRAKQLGTLLAMGFTRGQIALLMLGEGAIVGILGAGVGVGGGLAYAHGVLDALSGVWAGAVAGVPVLLHVTPMSLTVGPLSALLVSMLAILLALRSLTNRPARELLSGAIGKVSGPPRFKAWVWLVAALAFLLPTILLANFGTGMIAALAGFGAGASMLIFLLCVLSALLARWSVNGAASQDRGKAPKPLSMLRLAARNLARRRGRTLAAVITLSCGVFLVLAVSGFRLGMSDDPSDRKSGTGGFALIVETGQPIRYDLNRKVGRDHYGLGDDEIPVGSVVPFRINAGDDASCLNLNQTPRPRVMGIDPALLQSREAFRFMPAIGGPATWDALNQSTEDQSVIPAIADANTAQWALKVAVGGTLTLRDERGQPFDIKLVGTIDNTILQGSLIISEEHFERLYPGIAGHRMLLIDSADQDQADTTAQLLEDIMVDEGVTITATEARLAEYNTVQNTYLSIFQLLGGLGVVLGALGLGVIAARNLLERRSELAILSAVGVGQVRVLIITLIEHSALLAMGLGLGMGSAIVATLHTGRGLGGSGDTALATACVVLIAGLIAVAIGLGSAMSGQLTQALRND